MGDGGIRDEGSWSEVFGDLLAETCEEAVKAAVLDADDAAAVLWRFRESREVFDAGREPVLVHNDIWAPNILVGEEDGRWSVRAIIDADRAVFADREFEYILWDEDALQAHFLAGYGTPLDESAEALYRRTFYRFYWYLFAAWAYRAQIWRPDAHAWSLRVAMEALEQIRGEGYSA
jgi:aminoglycoside phosphotransferase (APT) family kinase protein